MAHLDVAHLAAQDPAEAFGVIVIWAMLAGPALFGIAALAFGLKLLSRAKQDGENKRILRGFAALLLLTAFGIGTCYTLMFSGSFA